MSKSVFLLILGFCFFASASSDAQQSRCADCHFANPQADPDPSHLLDWERSPHGRNGVGCESCHKGNAATTESFLAHQRILASRNPSILVHVVNSRRDQTAAAHRDGDGEADVDVRARLQSVVDPVTVQLGDVPEAPRHRFHDRSEKLGSKETPRLNFLLTNGQVMVASRWNHTLHRLERDGVHDCEICSIPHVEHDAKRRYRAVAIASEPITHEAWHEMDNATIVSVDEDLKVAVYPIG